jgi:hypothetical protein
MGSLARVRSDFNDAQDASVIGTAIVLINSLTAIWPVARKLMTGTFSDLSEKLVWILGLPIACLRKCGGFDRRAAAALQKRKEERAARRRRESVRKSDSIREDTVVRPLAEAASLVVPNASQQEDGPIEIRQRGNFQEISVLTPQRSELVFSLNPDRGFAASSNERGTHCHFQISVVATDKLPSS